ncbi:hypothetical protein E2C01_045305 [Portunus trituberculatus]|uniref:Uncharacterized protein n=1 Tax=Portunus trituberculatus TaxID=210409 RepID=A0A5B7G1R1_PORTR|nr:hypothetical protein [Portunus trituberculatus]
MKSLRLASFRDVALKSSFLLAVASARRQRLNSQVTNLSPTSTFLFFGNSEEDRLLCPVRAVREYLCRTRDCCPRCSHLFEPQHIVHPHTISHWIRQVVRRTHVNISEEDMHLVWVKAHEVRAVATSALFRKIQSILAVLRAGTWRRMSTFASFYLRNITHQYLDTFSLGPLVSALRMLSLPRLRDSRYFSPYSSSTEWADEGKTSSSALSEADVEGPAAAGSARFTGLKKEDMEEGPAVEPSAVDVEGPAVAGSAGVTMTGTAYLTGLRNE